MEWQSEERYSRLFGARGRGEASRAFRLHVATVVKNPVDFHVWVLYHGVHQGCVLHVYYDAEDREDGYIRVKEMLRLVKERHGSLTYHLHCTGLSLRFEGPAFSTNQVRQRRCINMALALVRDRYSDSENWMFHVDDDELIFANERSIRDAVDQNRGPTTTFIRLRNWEARIDVAHAQASIFDTPYFETDSRRFLLYANGKACAKVMANTHLVGPHCFSQDPGGRDYAFACGCAFVDNLLVLHYNCTTFDKWTNKYAQQALQPHNDSIFPFDRASDLLHRLVGTSEHTRRSFYHDMLRRGSTVDERRVDAFRTQLEELRQRIL